MYSNSPKPPRFQLRSSHRRPRLTVSHREVPSAWSAPSKDRDLPAAPVRGKKRR